MLFTNNVSQRGRYENTTGYGMEDVLNMDFKEEAKECGSFDKFESFSE